MLLLPFNDYFIHVSDVYALYSRSSGKVCTEFASTSTQRFSLVYTGPTVQNSLPSVFEDYAHCASIKKCLKLNLFAV